MDIIDIGAAVVKSKEYTDEIAASIVAGDIKSIAREYDATSTYAVGNYCLVNAKLYRCNTAITVPEAWNVLHWTETTSADEICTLSQNKQDKVDLEIYDGKVGIADENHKPVLTNSTGTRMTNALNAMAVVMAKGADEDMTYDSAARLIRSGLGQKAFPVGTQVNVTIGQASVPFTVLGHDYDTPVNPYIPHTMTIGMNNIFENRQFDAPEALIATPNGLTNARYYVTSANGAYNNSTTEDGNFGFTPTVTPNLVRYVRHSTMGGYRTSYAKSNVLSGKFITYGADFAQIEQCNTSEGDDGTSLGTVTAQDPQYKVGTNVNYTLRNAYGSNDWSTSNIRQILNSTGTGWWRQQTPFDFPPANVSSISGFLTDVDPDLIAVMQSVKKRYAKNIADGGGYADTEDKVFLLGMTEINFGKNNGIDETSYGINNTVITTPYPYYVGATNADRIKLLNASPLDWCLRGANPSHWRYVRIVYTDGSLSGGNAYSTYGIAAACVIG